ncbi:diguanylate cyclase [Vibrio hannami]|uniref:sensor domain-containing diguanylate cyclase n=1 Tax=Vibrio hannami TaxID=2717094 RepID=UPI002410190A|nr:diguanylate cyclase [Vibrio hannami]MDG3086412.1 diguanylate cyclase [Vibrio hannami]
MIGRIINKLTLKGKARFLRYAFYVTFFLSLVIAFIYYVTYEKITVQRASNQFSEIEDMRVQLLEKYQSVSSDLFYFSQNNLTRSVLETNTPEDIQQLTSVMMKFGMLHHNYDQIRLLDKEGNEVIRINQNEDLSLTNVPESKLQNKKGRYYFDTTKELASGDVYISKFDLNVERGQIEFPVKPVLRFSTPVYSAENTFLGIGVINYLGTNVISLLESLNRHEGDLVYLLNEDGYFLNHQESAKNWLFMYPDKEQVSFSSDYSEIWNQIKEREKGLVNYKGEEYYFTRLKFVDFPLHNVVNFESLYIVMRVPHSVISEEYQILTSAIFMAFIMLFPMALLMSYKLYKSHDEQERLIQELNFQAYHDSLTGLYNRQAIYEHLKKSILVSQRRKSLVAIGFIDVNNLKEANDKYGHDAGDDLIKGVSTAIETCVRQSDYASRLGGDEFLVIFVDCDKAQAQKTMKRIEERYRLLGEEKGKNWSLCFGCAQLQGKEDTMQDMINRADSEMYKQKNQFKQTQKNVDLKVSKQSLINIRSHSMDLQSCYRAVQSLNESGVVIDVSPEWEKLTGYVCSEAIGRHFTEFLDSQSLKQVEKNFPQLKGYGYVNDVHLMIKRKDGTTLSTILNGTSKYDDDGKFVRTYCEITPRV